MLSQANLYYDVSRRGLLPICRRDLRLRDDIDGEGAIAQAPGPLLRNLSYAETWGESPCSVRSRFQSLVKGKGPKVFGDQWSGLTSWRISDLSSRVQRLGSCYLDLHAKGHINRRSTHLNVVLACLHCGTATASNVHTLLASNFFSYNIGHAQR